MLTRETSELGCFLLPACLCAARLTPEQFRVYVYLVAHTGDTFPDQKTMADACMITVVAARAAGTVLKERGMLEVKNATGFPPRYHLTGPSKWLPPEEPPKTQGHAEFIKLWTDAYLIAHGEKYAFEGAKDAAMTKALLIRTGLKPPELMEIAIQAWKHPDWFNCKQSMTIGGFNSRFNDIRHELKNPPNGRNTANSKTDRNTGTNNAGRAETFKGVGRIQVPVSDVRGPELTDYVG